MTGHVVTEHVVTGHVVTEHAVAEHASSDPVLRLAGEIAVQFQHRPPAEAAAAVAEHIRAFWDPRMRRTLYAAIDHGAEADQAVREAAAQLREA